MNAIRYACHNKDLSVLGDITNVIVAVKQDFTPPLDEQLRIGDYCDKLAQKAVNIIAYHETSPAGLVSFYFNKMPAYSYVSMFAVKSKYRKFLIGIKLEKLLIEYCKSNGSKGILGEVNLGNEGIVKLDKTFGFKFRNRFTEKGSNILKAEAYLDF